MNSLKRTLFGLFFLSGFCGLLYQVVWLRLAFSKFGVVTPVISVVLSVFMLGLSLGSWASGPILARLRGLPPLKLYAIAELVVGLSAFCVPWAFNFSAHVLEGQGELHSGAYLIWSAMLISVSILPWCFAMGTTFPFAMAELKNRSQDSTGFSSLYLANVMGAMSGTLLTAFVLIELFGFRASLMVGAAMNLLIALIAWFASGVPSLDAKSAPRSSVTPSTSAQSSSLRKMPKQVLWTLGVTGFVSMGMEVIWTRAFTPITQTTIYAFAALLIVYLLATWLGSAWYRHDLKRGRSRASSDLLWGVAATAFLPLFFTDPRLDPRIFNIVLGLFPFCILLGYLTPKLIDEAGEGHADRVGRLYAVNTIGCILGPLAAGYFLIPLLGVKWALLGLGVLLVGMALVQSGGGLRSRKWAVTALVLAVGAAGLTQSYEDPSLYLGAEVRRDSTATVIAEGEGMKRRLLVNGIGITHMTPITKIMAHLPLATFEKPAESALVICFGMGTSFRSLSSWGVETTAVELVKSVKESFGYFFADAEAQLQNPKNHVIIDDGRRFLKRTSSKFDLVTLDPPPPVEAAGSSLLYSVEFYQDVKKRLKSGGILQQWFPGGEARILSAMTESITQVFPHVIVLHSIENWGYHFLASETPITLPNPSQMLARMPARAKVDLMEWYPDRKIEEVVAAIVDKQIPIERLKRPDAQLALTDDRPYNEYFFLRRIGRHGIRGYEMAP